MQLVVYLCLWSAHLSSGVTAHLGGGVTAHLGGCVTAHLSGGGVTAHLGGGGVTAHLSSGVTARTKQEGHVPILWYIDSLVVLLHGPNYHLTVFHLNITPLEKI